MEFRKMRRFKQQLSDEEAAEVLTNEKRGVLSVNGEGGYPYAFPINYYYDKETGKIYFHCAKQGHKFDALKADNKACFTVYENGEQRDDWSYFVRSVIVFGKIRFIEDVEETMNFVRRLGLKYYPKNETDIVEAEVEKFKKTVQMLELTADCVTGKLTHEK